MSFDVFEYANNELKMRQRNENHSTIRKGNNKDPKYQAMLADQTYDGLPEIIPPDPALSDLIDCT